MPLLSDIHIRDPFILPVAAERAYYMYGTTGRHLPDGTPAGFDAYRSTNLQDWEGPFPVFERPPTFWSNRDFWAPEVHYYADAYYMFASFKRDGVCRGTQILRSESPRGPFAPISDGPVTPHDWECLDGTLFVDHEAQPWIVFCHEWLQVHDGEIRATRLSSDLREPRGEPLLLFRASEAPWGNHNPGQQDFVTDGPFLHRCADGTLLMLWSSFGPQGYTQGLARSESGLITGPWHQLPDPLYADDGGHGMLFRAFDGNLYVSLHKPNVSPHERPLLLRVEERAGTLVRV